MCHILLNGRNPVAPELDKTRFFLVVDFPYRLVNAGFLNHQATLQVSCRSNGLRGHEPSGHSGTAAANGFGGTADGTDAAYDATNDANGNANDATDDGNCWNCWNCWNGSSKYAKYFLYGSDATGAAVVHGGSGGGKRLKRGAKFQGMC